MVLGEWGFIHPSVQEDVAGTSGVRGVFGGRFIPGTPSFWRPRRTVACGSVLVDEKLTDVNSVLQGGAPVINGL